MFEASHARNVLSWNLDKTVFKITARTWFVHGYIGMKYSMSLDCLDAHRRFTVLAFSRWDQGAFFDDLKELFCFFGLTCLSI